MSKSILFGDLFAGAGGFSLGLNRAGLADAYALESDSWACDTLRENFGCLVLERDIRAVTDEEIQGLPRPQVVVGGPPCQGFSVAGPTQYGVEDPRNNLFMHYLRFVELQLPDICIIENVPQLLTKRIGFGATAADVICEQFSKLGYKTQTFVLNAADFGVPQSRKRAFVVACHPDLQFKRPHGTHTPPSDDLVLIPDNTEDQVTVWEAISDLPEIDAGQGADEQVDYPDASCNEYQALMREGSEGVRNHIAMKHTQRLVERFKTIKNGKSLKDVSAEHGQLKYRSGEVNARPYKSNNQRLDPDSPSLAIPASFQSNFLHPYRHRNLTAREAARLMSFPDAFVFRGKRTAMSWEKHLSQYNQIGNAVCPLVSEALGRACIAAIGNVAGKFRFKLEAEATCRVTVPVHDSEEVAARLLPANSKIIEHLTRESLALINDQVSCDESVISYSGFSIPLFYLAAAILFSTEDDCPVCREDLPPHREHRGEMPFLISKDDIASLQSNEKDHGLDYHLRSLDGCPHQVGHFVGEILEKIGCAETVTVKNPRTGRNVRGLRVSHVPKPIADLRNAFRECIISNKKSPNKSVQPTR